MLLLAVQVLREAAVRIGALRGNLFAFSILYLFLLFARSAGRARLGRADRPVGGVSVGILMNEPRKDDDGIVLTEAQKRARRSRSIAIARVARARWSCCSTS